ncbi:uncharacterized protein Dvar_65050 [Desulfosarcina variabilis str. Montpellier]
MGWATRRSTGAKKGIKVENMETLLAGNGIASQGLYKDDILAPIELDFRKKRRKTVPNAPPMDG